MDFISSLLFNAAKNTQRALYSTEFLSDPMKIFDAIDSQLGFFVHPGIPRHGEAIGGLGRGNAAAVFNEFYAGMGCPYRKLIRRLNPYS